jgi:tRNA dimethylallyltransferase
LAERFPVEIVSVDSAQVYRGMGIGTAKPDASELARVPHHLIDILDPTETYSAARFRADALQLIEAIVARGRVPLLAGGTMLYFRALTHGLDDLPQADPELRARIERDARERGWPAMHAELAVLDPDTAARLEPNDAQRIQRALEIVKLTGKPMSAQLGARQGVDHAFRAIGLMPADRAELHARIAQRFDAMLEAGLVDELRCLRRDHPALHAGLPSMKSVGYRQAWAYLEGEYGTGAAARDELRNRGIYATRQLAKRQMTWMRSMPGLTLVDPLPDGWLGEIERLMTR